MDGMPQMAEIKIKVNGEPVFGYTEESRSKIDAAVDQVPGSAFVKDVMRKSGESVSALRGGVGRMARSGVSFAKVGLTETAKFSASAQNLSSDPEALKARAWDAARNAATGAARQAERTREIASQSVFDAITPWVEKTETKS